MLRRRAFRYETLLRVRRLHEEQQALRLAGVRRQILRAQQERDSILEEQRRILDAAGRAATRRFDPAEVQRFYNYERYLARRAVERDAELASLGRQESERLGELETATRRKRIVERLKEHHTATSKAELNKAEQKITDEAAVRQAAVARKADEARVDSAESASTRTGRGREIGS